jgi:serine-type D-Ala-D-Ala carboxypeptidase (penicillin-binding protein 5/6)
MSHNLKIFFAGFLLSMPFWWGLNALNKGLEDFFFGLELAQNPQLFTAQAALQARIQEQFPVKKNDIPLKLASTSALSVFVGNPNQESKVLFEQDAEKKLAIASLTKLMGALVVVRNIPLDSVVTITRQAVQEEENFGLLSEGDRFVAHDLLYPLLMESSNDASAAFALELGMTNFVRFMNDEAHFLGLNNTFFTNHAGLDPDIQGDAINYSTANDIFLLTEHLKTFYPSVFEILGLPEHPLYTTDGTFHHTMKNTNELLSANGWPAKVLGGKTGWTPQAQGALVLVLESPKKKGYLVNVVLGSESRFEDMKTLVNWVFDSWRF